MRHLFYRVAVVAATAGTMLALGAGIGSASPAIAYAPAESFAMPEPDATCDRPASQYVIRWTVENFTPHDAQISRMEPLGDGIGHPIPMPANLGFFHVPGSNDGQPGRFSIGQRVPGTSTNVGLRVLVTDAEGAETTIERFIELAGDCAPPTVRFETSCANEVTVTFTNVAKSGNALRVTVNAAGGFTKSVELAPRGSATVTVPEANAAGEIGAFFFDSNTEREIRIATGFRTPRTDCAPALPVTGTPTAGLVIGGIAILATGAVLLMIVSRRRRVRFTA